MDRSLEAKAWRRGFAAGFLALALSVGGQVATTRLGRCAASCTRPATPTLVERVIDHLRPRVRAEGGVAQRVAFAVLDAVLHKTCS